MKRRILIFGASGSGRMVLSTLSKDTEIIGFLDNDKTKWGSDICGIQVLGNANIINEYEAIDEIIIASINGIDTIKKQLMDAGVPLFKINTSFMMVMIQARINFVENFAKMNAENLKDCCIAEGGVFQGDFSKELNRIFPNNKLFLFDTFEGFDLRDIEKEKLYSFSDAESGHLNITNEELVRGKMLHKEMTEFRKGYFPESALGLEKEKFLFVNLDFDLYAPTLAGLEFFFPRLVDGGVILVHDFFSDTYKGVRQAVKEFEEKNTLVKLPIGDNSSVVIIRPRL